MTREKLACYAQQNYNDCRLLCSQFGRICSCQLFKKSVCQNSTDRRRDLGKNRVKGMKISGKESDPNQPTLMSSSPRDKREWLPFRVGDGALGNIQKGKNCRLFPRCASLLSEAVSWSFLGRRQSELGAKYEASICWENGRRATFSLQSSLCFHGIKIPYHRTKPFS